MSMFKKREKKAKTIGRQIFKGFISVTMGTVFVFAVSVLYLSLINIQYRAVERNTQNEASTQSAIVAHYQWLENLNVAIQSGTKFTGSLDHTTCGLGTWISNVDEDDIADPIISKALKDLMEPHEFIHKNAQPLIDKSNYNKTEAYQSYTDSIKPQGMKVIDSLNTITTNYREKSDSASALLQRFIGSSIFICALIAFIAIIASIVYAKRLSNKISQPILAVSNWSKKLSIGIDELAINETIMDVDAESEIGIMMDSFKLMATSIQDNVNVVKRVADGDMTAFVSIRSSEDSLGKNLYRMVQSNNALFTNIIHIANTVALASSQIATTSQTLAQSASDQASAVQSLSDTVDMAATLTMDNGEKSVRAAKISEQMRVDANRSNDMMIDLVDSVNEISTSSKKIATVIKSIDDIAFQTNILALNAAVEAARAGSAGKGFAVVADEVRNLALKSAEAANETKLLIEDSIRKVNEGSKISHETADTVGKIIVSLNQIIELVGEIAGASNVQTDGVKQIRREIELIANSITSNVAISEESAASSEEMSSNAELLNNEMTRFNLRERKGGSAYIPPEKQGDTDYIRVANENYNISVKTGHYGHEYLDPNYKDIVAETINV